jgi:hypothetical protein
MRHLILILSLILVGSSFAPLPTLAQTGVPQREAVCVNLGGDALSLETWDAEQIAEFEATSEQPVTRAHPATGTCFDPAGLMLFPGRGDPEYWSYDCEMSPAGWVGPIWTIRWYHLPGVGRAPISPVTGGCPPPAAPQPIPLTSVRPAAATAVYISQLEMNGDLALLAEWLHPDAQAEVPATALAGWYQAEWRPRGPQAILVEDVRFGNWTWAVNGVTYSNTAEITYQQVFADGTVETGTAHLVQVPDGAWRWFFGPSQQFLDEVIATYGN